MKDETSLGFAGGLAARFVDSKLTPILVLASVLLGLAATLMLPREEEPQIKVPMIDVFVSMPGATAKEIEQRVTRPMEKLLWEIPDVEYLYSTSSPGQSMVIVRFEVGQDIEEALVRLNQKLETNYDRIPAGVSPPLVKPRSIDDVPILALTFHGQDQGHDTLRRLVAQVDEYVKQVPMVSETTMIGGLRRQVRVLVDPVKMSAHGVDFQHIAQLVQAGNAQYRVGTMLQANEELLVEVGDFFTSLEDVERLVVAVDRGRPVYLSDIARVVDGPEEPADYVYFGSPAGSLEPGVTLSIAKRPGANAITVVHNVLKKVNSLRGTVIPEQIEVSITRDYGETAREKSDELLFHMGIAVFSVALLIMFFLGYRESIVVLLAIPATLGLTLAVFYLYGYTLNRITLFALIFSIGILVDDAIVVVENIARHVRLPGSKDKSLSQITIEAVAEVGNPTVLATWAVIAAILPMAFVGGLMGPYMRPIPVGASAAMLFSLLVAFIVTPWAAERLLFLGRSREKLAAAHDHEGHEGITTRAYRFAMNKLLHSVVVRWSFLFGIVVLLLGSMTLVGIGYVKVKMLPFDNKSEFQVIINSAEGTTLEETLAIAQEMARAIEMEPEVKDYQIYAGTAAPYNFNGLVRHYFLRGGSTHADIQVNLVGKHHRKAQSHDVAVRVRPRLAEIAERYGANVEVAEVPPGPPVLQTLVAEVYGPDDAKREALAAEVKQVFESTDGVVDIDWYVQTPQKKIRYVIRKDKATIHGLSADQLARTIQTAVSGQSIGLLHQPEEREDVPIHLELPLESRSRAEDMLTLRIAAADGSLVALSELVEVEETLEGSNIYHKNLMPVTYVTADVAGRIESPAYAIFAMNGALKEIDMSPYSDTHDILPVFNASLPVDPTELAMKWDGEWDITLEVFRDLGLAFAAVLILIYMLMVGWFRSFVVPFIVMAAIPFSLIGILPAHGAMGAFFTATSMIGFMAGAGIVVRNSIILVDFIELRLKEGHPLDVAVVEAGAIRFRPMLLTALAVVVAAAVILADPIFQGLALSLMAGEVASLLVSRIAVPVLYYIYKK